MSLDLTIGTRPINALADADAVETSGLAPATRLWLQNLAMIGGTTFGVLLSSALGVLLFLR